MGYNYTHIEVSKMKFFTDETKQSLVINLILQLGVQSAGQYMPIEHTKTHNRPLACLQHPDAKVEVKKYHKRLLAYSSSCYVERVATSPRHEPRVLRLQDLLVISSMRRDAAPISMEW